MDPNNNEKAFLQLIRDNKGILFKISNSYCRSKNDREDLMQEIIYQLWRRHPWYHGNECGHENRPD